MISIASRLCTYLKGCATCVCWLNFHCTWLFIVKFYHKLHIIFFLDLEKYKKLSEFLKSFRGQHLLPLFGQVYCDVRWFYNWFEAFIQESILVLGSLPRGGLWWWGGESKDSKGSNTHPPKATYSPRSSALSEDTELHVKTSALSGHTLAGAKTFTNHQMSCNVPQDELGN